MTIWGVGQKREHARIVHGVSGPEPHRTPNNLAGVGGLSDVDFSSKQSRNYGGLPKWSDVVGVRIFGIVRG